MCHMPVNYIEAVLLIITSCILYTLTILYFLYNLYIIHIPLTVESLTLGTRTHSLKRT